MRKFKQLLNKLKSNAGSSIVMVIVSVAFVAIIVGALLAAAMQSYRMKLEDLNSRDNFYYVEQAMNEIYAGVGTQTVQDLQDAYIYTVENMVKYDVVKGTYVSETQEKAQEMFAKEFYSQLQNNPFFSASASDLADKLESYISNDTVKLDKSAVYFEDYKVNGVSVGKIIKNVKLSRTQEYDRNIANGVFTQSITTDIVVGNPDFKVVFDSVKNNDPNIFKYALVADMGVEVDQPSTPLTIAGNIYAAADYYNKEYNSSTSSKNYSSPTSTYTITLDDGTQEDLATYYTHGSVTSKVMDIDADGNPTDACEYYNKLSTINNDTEVAGTKDWYNGETIKSKYSGFYVNGSQVSVIANTVVVPGTIAVMDTGSLSIYGSSGSQTTKAEVWTDNVVLDGYSTVKNTTQKDGSTKTTYSGSEAILKSNVFVKDDTEINAAGSTLLLSGSYFGYGDSTEKDTRKFTPVVDADNFQVSVTSNGTTTKENRGHYNSSAIIVNGEQSELNFEMAQTIFLAGRTYIELSKEVSTVDGTVATETTDAEGKTTTTSVNTVKDTYTYHPTDYNAELSSELRTDSNNTTTIRDYQTGESISIKSNQLAYIPVTYNGIPKAVYVSDSNKTAEQKQADLEPDYYLAELYPALKGSELFEKYFPNAVFDGKVPCVLQEISGKKYYYYDFQTAYDLVKTYNSTAEDVDYNAWLEKFPSAKYFAAGFIEDYCAELNKHKTYVKATNKGTLEDSAIAEYLTDIGDYEDFDAGNIILPDKEINVNASIYSSGAITVKSGTTFSITRSDDTSIIGELLTSAGLEDMNAGNSWTGSVDGSTTDKESTVYTEAYQLSNDLEMEYEYMKWNLGHYTTDTSTDPVTSANYTAEKAYIKELVNSEDFGDASITPINKFLDMSKITSTTNITPNLTGNNTGSSVLDLASGFSVWVSNDDVMVEAKAGDKGEVRGIVITKGDVYFDTDVTSFEGMIVAGGKIYISGYIKDGKYVESKVSTISSSAELCRSILRECVLNKDENSKFLLSLFRGYTVDTTEDTATGTDASAKSIDMIDYTDVVSFSNWMKNVE